MKSFLNKSLFWGSLLLLLKEGEALAQPIQLIPHHENMEREQPQEDAPLASPQVLPEFWEGTPPSVIETYFPRVPLKLTSPVLRELRAHLVQEKYTELLQNAAYNQSLLSLLIAEGKDEQANELIMERSLPEKESLLLDLQWLTGHPKKACEKITNLIRTSLHLEWKKQNIYCLYLNGEEARAKIAAEVLSESNPEAAQLLNTLFDSSLKPPLDESVAKSPFLLTVWLESQQDIPEEKLQNLSSAALALIARSEKAPLQTRLLSAEKALQQGLFKEEDFLALVKDVPQTEFWGQLLHELASGKFEGLLPLFEQAEKEGKLSLLPQVFSSFLSSMEPSLETLSLAPFMIRAFLQNEKKDLAKKWGTFLMREAPDEAIVVLPLLHFAIPENKWGESQIQAWQAYQGRVHSKTAPQHSYELRRILEAFKEPTGHPMKDEPSPPSWRQEKALFDGHDVALLESAAESKRRGEVLLMVLAIIGETPLHELSVDKFVPILKALDKVGYQKEARELALEFLLAKGM
jgi:hypothetical protein